MTSFLAQFYEEVPPARLILVDRELPEGGACWPRRWRSGGRQGRDLGAPARGPAAG
jgi:excinuclease ABC subunit C